MSENRPGANLTGGECCKPAKEPAPKRIEQILKAQPLTDQRKGLVTVAKKGAAIGVK